MLRTFRVETFCEIAVMDYREGELLPMVSFTIVVNLQNPPSEGYVGGIISRLAPWLTPVLSEIDEIDYVKFPK